MKRRSNPVMKAARKTTGNGSKYFNKWDSGRQMYGGRSNPRGTCCANGIRTITRTCHNVKRNEPENDYFTVYV